MRERDSRQRPMPRTCGMTMKPHSLSGVNQATTVTAVYALNWTVRGKLVPGDMVLPSWQQVGQGETSRHRKSKALQ